MNYHRRPRTSYWIVSPLVVASALALFPLLWSYINDQTLLVGPFFIGPIKIPAVAVWWNVLFGSGWTLAPSSPRSLRVRPIPLRRWGWAKSIDWAPPSWSAPPWSPRGAWPT